MGKPTNIPRVHQLVRAEMSRWVFWSWLLWISCGDTQIVLKLVRERDQRGWLKTCFLLAMAHIPCLATWVRKEGTPMSNGFLVWSSFSTSKASILGEYTVFNPCPDPFPPCPTPSLASLLNIVAQFGMGVVSPRVVRIEGLIAMASQHLLRSSKAEVKSLMFQGELLHEMWPPLLSRSS